MHAYHFSFVTDSIFGKSPVLLIPTDLDLSFTVYLVDNAPFIKL